MKTIITPKQALEQVRRGHLSQLKGLDERDFTYVFDKAREVILLTYFKTSQQSPKAVIIENRQEIQQYADKAKGVFLQMTSGNSHQLSMEEMDIIETVQQLFQEDMEFSWDADASDISEELRINLYITF